MNEAEHFKRLNRYFSSSRWGYDNLLWGAKHFGYYPKDKKVSEKEAQVLMHDLIGKKLNLKNSMKVLDAGCGQGVVSTYLAKKFGCRIEGITMVNFEIEVANKLAEEIGVSDKVNYSLMDYSNMEFENNTFDVIYTIETLCHSTDIKKTLKEFYRVLRKNGSIALFEYRITDDSKFSDYQHKLGYHVIEATAAPSLRKFRFKKFAAMVKAAGFKNVKEEDITENFEPSLNRLRKFALAPYFCENLQEHWPWQF